MFSDGDEFIDVDDLHQVPQTPDEALLAGELGEADAFNLRLSALYLRHAYRFDARSGLSNARVEPKLHQVFVAHRIANKLQPRMLLADEVGLGKTIEAGLVLKELRARGLVERVLIVCPASLQHQWQNELQSKFNEQFEIMNAPAAKYLSQGKANPFMRRDNIITSLNFAQQEKRQEQIIEAPWDLVIFDEAHRVRRSLQGGSKISSTQAYRLADELKELTPGFLLLTATPMQLHPFELFSLVELVEPGLFRDYRDYDNQRQQLPILNNLMRELKQWAILDEEQRAEVLDENARLLTSVAGDALEFGRLDDPADVEMVMDRLIDRHPLAEVMVRNRKAEIGGFAGRQAHSIVVQLLPEEMQLYEDITDYLRYNYNLAVTAKQNAVGFLMVTYQKMLASSSYAVLQSFRRRVAKLQKQASTVAAAKKRPVRTDDPIDDLLDDLESSEFLEDLAGAWTLDEAMINVEIEELTKLIGRLENLETDSKAEDLIGALETIWAANPDEKVVIFTTFRDTQVYLQGLIEKHARAASRQVKVAKFNGTLNVDEKEEAIRKFRADHQVLISTESGGEGRNLQFAHLLVNYDLPWNPMKVEQRIGRLDRIGQNKKVFIYNLACKDTVEERVLTVLEHRIKLFTESVGSLDPILGEIENQLESLVMRHHDQFDIEFNNLEEDVERRSREARENERVLADFVLDRASLRRDDANRLLGEAPLATSRDLERYCEAVLSHSGGTLMPHADGGQAITLSPKLSNRLHAKSNQIRGVFDPGEALAHEDLDFFAFGNELIDRLVAFPIDNDPVTATARSVGYVEGGPFVEAVYELRAETTPPIGRVIRHLVDQHGVLHSEEIDSPPPVGRPVDLEVPDWAQAAIAASRSHFQEQQTEMRDEVLRLNQIRAGDRVQRAERIFRYRQSRLSRSIQDQEAWLRDARISESDKVRRIIPARNGRLKKDRERLATLEAGFNDEVSEIESHQPAISGTLWAASVVVGQ